MTMTDPIADFLTRIRNAQMASKPWTDIPVSKLKIRLSYVLKEESFIRDYILIKGDPQDKLRIFLNYDFSDSPVRKNNPSWGFNKNCDLNGAIVL